MSEPQRAPADPQGDEHHQPVGIGERRARAVQKTQRIEGAAAHEAHDLLVAPSPVVEEQQAARLAQVGGHAHQEQQAQRTAQGICSADADELARALADAGDVFGAVVVEKYQDSCAGVHDP